MISNQLKRSAVEIRCSDQGFLRCCSWHLDNFPLNLNQALKILYISNGSPECLHLAQALVTWQVIPEFSIALIHTLHSLTLPLIALLNKRWLKGTLIDIEMVVGKWGQAWEEAGVVAPKSAFIEAKATTIHGRRVKNDRKICWRCGHCVLFRRGIMIICMCT